MLDCSEKLSLRKQSKLLNICRSSFYYKSIKIDDSDLANLIQEVYLSSNCIYGYRKITKSLNILGHHKKVLRIMKEMGIEGRYPKKKINTSLGNPLHRVYPYLLADITISYPNQVWATDITYIKIKEKFAYFFAIIDLYSRYIVAYDLSPTLDAVFCIACLKDALQNNDKPKIFNSDQGSQFTCHKFIDILVSHNINISMDHQGRCFDNIYVERLWRTLKQEAIYYEKPSNLRDLELCINRFVYWYNNKRLHQSLEYQIPVNIYKNI